MTKLSGSTYRHALSERALDDRETAYAYETVKHTPNDFQVEMSYLHFKHETLAQFQDIRAGIVPLWDDGSHEYKGSNELFHDLDKGVAYVRHTWLSGDNYSMPNNHPMLESVNRYLPGNSALLYLNDIFRFVHDVNGHYGGQSEQHFSFGPTGELNAWKRHRSLYSQTALLALWCETRGQSAWVNDYDDHRSLPLKDRPFAPQKAGYVPEVFR